MTGRRAIHLPPLREKCSTAYRARLHFRGRPFGSQRRLQRRVKGQNGVSKILAVSARPPFVQHIALAIEGEAAVILIIVSAHGSYQLADRRALGAGELTGLNASPLRLRAA